jgi:hypothetical protein
MGCYLLAGKYGLYSGCADVQGGQKFSAPLAMSRLLAKWTPRRAGRCQQAVVTANEHRGESVCINKLFHQTNEHRRGPVCAKKRLQRQMNLARSRSMPRSGCGGRRTSQEDCL